MEEPLPERSGAQHCLGVQWILRLAASPFFPEAMGRNGLAEANMMPAKATFCPLNVPTLNLPRLATGAQDHGSYTHWVLYQFPLQGPKLVCPNGFQPAGIENKTIFETINQL